MSKNMTRKGLAFGAGLALVASGLGAAPANAIELSEGIVLAPSSGPTSAYAIFADDGASFSIDASPVTSVMAGSGTVKFKVSDPNASFSPGANSTTGASEAVADNATGANFVVNVASDMVAITHANGSVGDGSYLVWATTDLNVDKGTPGAADLVILPKDTLVEAFVSGTKVWIKSAVDLTAGNKPSHVDGAVTLNFVSGGTITSDAAVDIANNATLANVGTDTVFDVALTDFGLGAGDYIMFEDTAALNLDKGTDGAADKVVGAVNEGLLVSVIADGTATITTDATLDSETAIDGAASVVLFKVPVAVRAADNSYVVDSGVTAAGTTASLELIANGATTQTATVQAWVDDFNNNSINAGSEYTSVAQAVQFLENDDVTVVTNLVAPSPGDSSLVATITTSPMINGAQDDKTDPIAAIITRQSSVSNALVVATQATLTGLWTATINTDISATTVKHWVNATTDLDTESWMKSYTGTTGVRMDDAVEALGRVDRSRVVIKDDIATVTTQDGAVTDGTREAHFLQVGDKVTFDGTATGVLTSTEFTILTVPSEFTFTFAVPADTTDVSYLTDNTSQSYTVTTWGSGVAKRDRVYAGDHTAVGALETATNRYEVSGASSASGTLAQTSADTFVTTVGSATVQEASVNNATGDTVTDSVIKKGVTSVAVIASVVDALGVSVGAGRSVAATVTVNSGGSSVKVNGLAAPANQVTDANGQVTFTVTDGVGATGTKVTLAIVPEGVTAAGADFTIEWETQAYSLYDLNTTEGVLTTDDRQVLAGTSYAMDLLVADQWYQPAPSDTYRLKVTGSGVTEGVQTLVAGKAAVTISDLGIGTSFATNLIVQKATSGVFADSTTTTITTKTAAAAATSVTLGADGSSLYASATADLSDAVSSKALVERDNRTAFVAQPAYTSPTGGALVVTGKVTKKSNGTSSNDAVVTISGANSILFSDGLVDNRGGLTLVADDSGEFSVTLYSTTAQTNSVITVTAMGVSSTVKVSFTGIGVGEGTSLVVTTPAAVKPASTFQVKAKLADAYGNGVNAGATAIKVTYTGPGIVFGTLPTTTDANGELQFAVLLGSNDTGTITVTVSYDQNGDLDYVDTKDLVTTATTVINATGVVAADAKVNVGSFKGYVALYAKGYKGKKMSAIVAGKWIVVASLASDFERVVRYTGAGYDIVTTIYIDGVSVQSFNVTTK